MYDVTILKYLILYLY